MCNEVSTGDERLQSRLELVRKRGNPHLLEFKDQLKITQAISNQMEVEAKKLN